VSGLIVVTLSTRRVEIGSGHFNILHHPMLRERLLTLSLVQKNGIFICCNISQGAFVIGSGHFNILHHSMLMIK